MNESQLTLVLSSIIIGASPIILAVLGETITEKAGVINLSLDGCILLSAMTAFVVALKTQSVLLGFIGGAFCGAMVSAVVAIFGIYLNRSQVAVGFVLTLMTKDLAYFLGNPYSRIQGPQAAILPIPLLKDIPFIGTLFFNHTLPVYMSFILIGAVWWFFYKSVWGLELRSVGEHPEAAYARGINPKTIRLFYTIAGGALVGLGGAMFSLAVKPGWGRPQGAEGTGWIALALVIFGGWHPVKAAFGAYLFALLQVMGIYCQHWFPSMPSQVFQTAPFPLMIFTLLFIYWAQQSEAGGAPTRKLRLLRLLSGSPPAALGKPYRSV